MMGRITQSMMTSQMLQNLNRNLNQMNTYQDQMSTGRKINKPSDDPVGLSYSMRYRSDITANEQYQENVDSAISWIDFSDTLMDQANAALQRIRELTVQAANGSNPQTALDAVKSEVLQLTNQLITIGNSQFNGKYVFNGQKTNLQPFSTNISEVPLSISVHGNVDVSQANVTDTSNQLTIVVDQGKEVTVTLPSKDYSTLGSGVFAKDLESAINTALLGNSAVTVSIGNTGELAIASDNTGPSGSVEITGGSLAVNWLSAARNLSDLVKTPNPVSNVKIYQVDAQQSQSDDREIKFEIATGVYMPVNILGDSAFGKPGDPDNMFKVLNQIVNALGQGDTSKVSDLLGGLDSRMNKFLEVRADLGAKMNRVELSSDRLKDTVLNLTNLQSKTEDADMAETITLLKTYENVYQASLSVGAKVITPSLVDFLK
ncbi:flagellar hook-associated protein FlgL [Paenibacillus thalictri]|uniref:Flagellar hook-associated protein 3 n=1 Tax=Paenibacillus thalictri TaxID=2527873 RepID=A0A4Q9DLP2_9BACL|nr:flagellar hook-associated protein FlgL [Paenibacillus thalictri]TBL72993.1 flagellar hook-associated protein 3 [Paenibacillus thalictri]